MEKSTSSYTSLYDYTIGEAIYAQHYPFYALIQAAMRQADSDNLFKLQLLWPDVYADLVARYNAPGGVLAIDRQGEE